MSGAIAVVAGQGGVHDLGGPAGGYTGARAAVPAEKIVHHLLDEGLLHVRRMGNLHRLGALGGGQADGNVVAAGRSDRPGAMRGLRRRTGRSATGQVARTPARRLPVGSDSASYIPSSPFPIPP